MSASPAQTALIDQARHFYADYLVKNLGDFLKAITEGAYALADQPAERAVAQQRNDTVQVLRRDGTAFTRQLAEQIQARLNPGKIADSAASALVASMQGQKDLSLVDDATIRREIMVSRTALAIMDRSSWELSDLRARAMQATGEPELADDDIFRPQVLARCVVRAWGAANMPLDAWQSLEAVLHKTLSVRAEEAYHETNRWMIEHGVLPEVDLRPFIRRSDGTSTQSAALDDEAEPPVAEEASKEAPPVAAPAPAQGGRFQPPAAWRSLFVPSAASQGQASAGAAGQVAPAGSSAVSMGGYRAAQVGQTGPQGAGTHWGGGTQMPGGTGYHEETHMMTRPVGGMHARADVVLEQFGQIMERHVPGFRDTSVARPASERLSNAMAQVQQQLAAQVDAAAVPGVPAGAQASPDQIIREIRERSQSLKAAAGSPAERATIELVALLFQSILTDERIPSAIRVWFARLQMPVLRVAIAEPDFFSSEDHPARRLIDRMGACVMGFEGSADMVGPALENEIKRIVQVVEAFPDTGRRVFQTVLNEFEKFLESYYAGQNETTRMGISLAQQVEQRETLAIQYTIELRKLLDEVAVQDGIREFLFKIWADVLATTAVRHGGQSKEVKTVREAATELMWTASAKTTREERAEVIRRLPPLLATLRHGMSAAGMAAQKQEDAIKALNLALTAAFGARTASVTEDQLADLKRRLEAIEELLPDDDLEVDDSWVLDELAHDQEGLEVVAEGGSMPGPAMVEWALQLRLGDAFTLDYRGRHEVVRLGWQGMNKQLSLFVSAKGRSVLFQKARLAAFLQAGLLLPVQDESLTVAATRTAMKKIEADPARLVH
ncbi:MAG: DUF1631 family protein [Burkholderiales bacterium]|nr:DUF1631 family protein [Burkholderiales bacterium]